MKIKLGFVVCRAFFCISTFGHAAAEDVSAKEEPLQRPASEVAEALDVAASQLYDWRNKHGEAALRANGRNESVEDENAPIGDAALGPHLHLQRGFSFPVKPPTHTQNSGQTPAWKPNFCTMQEGWSASYSTSAPKIGISLRSTCCKMRL